MTVTPIKQRIYSLTEAQIEKLKEHSRDLGYALRNEELARQRAHEENERVNATLWMQQYLNDQIYKVLVEAANMQDKKQGGVQ